MSHAFAMQVEIKAHPGQGQRLIDIMLDAAALAKTQPGCQLYVVMQGMTDPDLIFVTEAWDSQEAHQNSLSDQAILGLVTLAKPLIQAMQHQVARPLGGLGLEPL